MPSPTLTYWRRRWASSDDLNRIFTAVQQVIANTVALEPGGPRDRYDWLARWPSSLSRLYTTSRSSSNRTPSCESWLLPRTIAPRVDEPGHPLAEVVAALGPLHRPAVGGHGGSKEPDGAASVEVMQLLPAHKRHGVRKLRMVIPGAVKQEPVDAEQFYGTRAADDRARQEAVGRLGSPGAEQARRGGAQEGSPVERTCPTAGTYRWVSMRSAEQHERTLCGSTGGPKATAEPRPAPPRSNGERPARQDLGNPAQPSVGGDPVAAFTAAAHLLSPARSRVPASMNHAM